MPDMPDTPDTSEEQPEERFYTEEEYYELKNKLLVIEHEREQFRLELRAAQMQLDSHNAPPYVLATIESVTKDGYVLLRSSAGPIYVTPVNPQIPIEEIVPGARCAMQPHSHSIVRMLPKEFDSSVTGMEIETAPAVSYDDIGGLNKTKQLIREVVELPLTRPDLFEAVGVVPPKGVLLCGPPGTGKTLLAKAVAHETKSTFIYAAASELVQKYIGEGARLVREMFELARARSPSIIFIDEIDAVGAVRTADAFSVGDHEVNRTLMQLLAELDGFNPRGNVRIIAATNRKDILDPALLRPGRFDRVIEFPLPDKESRLAILRIHTKGMSVGGGVSLDAVAEMAEGMNGAELMSVCVEAGMNAIREERTSITEKDFMDAVNEVRAQREGEKKGSK